MKSREHKLIEFVKEKHASQIRKYTNEPYYNHLLNVAKAADREGLRFGFEIGLCHDLLEDTTCTSGELFGYLVTIGYNADSADYILSNVVDLTDVFTSSDFPYLNRAIRKHCETLRLHNINSQAQIIKCFDLIDNTTSIVKHDTGFAKKYLIEKRDILVGFKNLPSKVKSLVWNCLLDAEEKLNILTTS